MIGPGFAAAAATRLLIPVFIALAVIGCALFGAGYVAGVWLH